MYSQPEQGIQLINLQGLNIQMIEQRRKNLKAFKISDSSNFLKIESDLNDFQTQILINKQSCEVFHEKKERIVELQGPSSVIEVSLILGIMTFESHKFLVYADEVYMEGRLPNHGHIYQISGVKFIKFCKSITKTEQEIMQTIQKELLSYGFYFSLQQDITRNNQSLFQEPHQAPIDKFFWNKSIVEFLSQNQKHKQWKIPVVQGHLAKYSSYINGHLLQYWLFSRRSKYRSGSQFYSCGINELGNCANYIETEQIISINNYLMSTVFLSANAPVFWEPRQQNEIITTRCQQLLKNPFVQHFNQLFSRYGKVFIMNLLSKQNKQRPITDTLERMFSLCENELSNNAKYVYLDWDNSQPDEIQNIFKKLQGVTKQLGYFILELNTKRVLFKQSGIYRVNGLKCITRTNNFLKYLGIVVLNIQLELLNLKLSDKTGDHYLSQLNVKTLQKTAFIKIYENVWHEKADYEHLMYTGSRCPNHRQNSLLDQATGSFISITQLYNWKYVYKMKQKALDTLLGHFDFKHKLQKNIANISQLSLSVCTWNVNATPPQNLQDLPKVLSACIGVDLIVIGIQEMIELNATNNVYRAEQQKTAHNWNNYLSNYLKDYKYIEIVKIEMVGVMMIIFISEKWKDSLRGVHKDIVKTGMGGQFGNKGGVIIRVNIFQTSLCFICAHLAAGEGKIQNRVEDLLQIHRKAFQQSRSGVQDQHVIEHSDYKFFFGDLNFRIDESFQNIYQMFLEELTGEERSKIIQQIIEQDQLVKLRQRPDTHYIISSYSQQEIGFLPTYKLEKDSGKYTCNKNRTPSWCDRVLYWADNDESKTCKCTFYDSISATGSDHRPVVARFLVNILKGNAIKKESNNQYLF